MMYSTWPAMSESSVPYVPPPDPGLESRTRIRKPSAFSFDVAQQADGGRLELGRGVLAFKQHGGGREAAARPPGPRPPR